MDPITGRARIVDSRGTLLASPLARSIFGLAASSRRAPHRYDGRLTCFRAVLILLASNRQWMRWALLLQAHMIQHLLLIPWRLHCCLRPVLPLMREPRGSSKTLGPFLSSAS
jgi:hypothetical protein